MGVILGLSLLAVFPATLIIGALLSMYTFTFPTGYVMYNYEASNRMAKFGGREFKKNYITLKCPPSIGMPEYNILHARLYSGIFYINYDEMTNAKSKEIISRPVANRTCEFVATVDLNETCKSEYDGHHDVFILVCGNERIRIHGFNNLHHWPYRGEVVLVPCGRINMITANVCFNATNATVKEDFRYHVQRTTTTRAPRTTRITEPPSMEILVNGEPYVE